ncbi:hypothetical protein BE20_24995 [Sorangium cellulosum]|uniref:Uncharacterized protein n=1 Tax=Sorangium cellulosum TaxID=56 RepID=A0A150S617_SORCE|nr:hypothetical protein BE20_24995 [Sorangium cellulosum]KYF89260.1 hypothetical protein BE18_22775 [Sorangium cellulosum]
MVERDSRTFASASALAEISFTLASASAAMILAAASSSAFLRAIFTPKWILSMPRSLLTPLRSALTLTLTLALIRGGMASGRLP